MFVRPVTLRRHLPAVLLTLAIAAYCASLLQGFGAARHGNDSVAFTQRYGAGVASTDGARPSANGDLTLHARGTRAARASWELPALRGVARGSLVEGEAVFTAGTSLRFARPDGYATIFLDHRPVALIHPGPGQFPGARTAGPDIPEDVLDVPPGARRAFRFPLAPSDACRLRSCAVGVELKDGDWEIASAGLRLQTQAPGGPPLWHDSRAVWVALFAVLPAAALSYAALFCRGSGPARTGNVRSAPLASTVALALLLAACVALIGRQGLLPSSAANVRTEVQERLGTQTVTQSGASAGRGNTLLLGPGRTQTAAASWSVLSYEFAHVLAHAGTCELSVYVAGPALLGTGPGARAVIELNGERVAAIPFGREPGDFPFTRWAVYPQLQPADIPITPLFRPYALIFPVASHFCTADAWNVRVTLHAARWPIDRVGILARFSPSRAALAAQPFALAAALALTCLLILALHALFAAVVRRFGIAALALTLGIFVAAVLTHDEWDFNVWLRFVDVAAFGHGNPAAMWGGTPLWPFLTALLAPLLAAVFSLTGDASQEVTALFLKLAMALALTGNALLLARQAPQRLERLLFLLLLLSPLGLYELAGGYRELFAGSFLILGCSLATRARYILAALTFSAAASISESLGPVLLLPMCLRLCAERRSSRPIATAVARALLDAAAGLAPLAILWLFFIPRSFVSTVVATRITSAYRFGGASWFSALDAFGLLPAWVGPHSLEIFVALFVALATPLAVLIVRATRSQRPAFVRERDVFAAFTGFVASFLIAFRGTDPATLYTLFALVAFYFARYDAPSPYPLFLSTLAAFAYYAILGIGDFANWTYLLPRNESLVGVLGTPMSVAVLAVQLALLALYAALLARRESLLFGRGSVWFCALFAAAAATVAVKAYVTDIVFCSAAAALLLLVFSRLVRLRGRTLPWQRSTALDYVGLATAIAAGAWAGTHSAAAALSAFVALLLGLAYGFGLCDVVLALCSSLMLATQTGYGWVSIGGWVMMSLLAVGAARYARMALGEAARANAPMVRGSNAAA